MLPHSNYFLLIIFNFWKTFKVLKSLPPQTPQNTKQWQHIFHHSIVEIKTWRLQKKISSNYTPWTEPKNKLNDDNSNKNNNNHYYNYNNYNTGSNNNKKKDTHRKQLHDALNLRCLCQVWWSFNSLIRCSEHEFWPNICFLYKRKRKKIPLGTRKNFSPCDMANATFDVETYPKNYYTCKHTKDWKPFFSRDFIFFPFHPEEGKISPLHNKSIYFHIAA